MVWLFKSLVTFVYDAHMAKDKFTATWVSHSSMRDYLACPRAYFLNNVYKDPKTGHKISLMSPPLALGQVVHEVIESLSVIAVEKRFDESLITKFEHAWQKVAGAKGGFLDEATEERYKVRGKDMLTRVVKHPGPLEKLAVKIRMNLPYFWLSEEDEIILCGKIDWLEYLPDTEQVHIIDFKTSKRDENEDSLQLPIYHLLAHYCQTYDVAKVSYWYLERADEPAEQPLPDLDESRRRVLKIAKEIKLARTLSRFKCPQGLGCRACRPLEAVVAGRAKLVGVNDFGQDVYILPDLPQELEGRIRTSEIL